MTVPYITFTADIAYIVFFALWIIYGRIELTLITFTSILLIWTCITKFMAMTGVEFNIVILTFIFALGINYTIIITDGLCNEYRTGRKSLPIRNQAIFMLSFTMIVCIGALIFSRHNPALKSVALVSIIGIFAILLISHTVQPFIFRWFISGRTQKGKYPYTLFSWLSSIYVFTYFGLTSIILSFLSVFIKIIPYNIKRKKYAIHWLMSKLTKSTLYCYPFTKKKYTGNDTEKFARPAMIVANHQSFMDILGILSLHPKIVMLVNSWVWKSPVFGTLVRNSDFYHVEDGIESSVDALRSKVADGYSVMVFPEGTRSTDGKTGRFHNGAFYLARQLDLDILPVTLYGMGLAMPKTDPFNIRKGLIVIDVLPRIENYDIKQRSDRENASYVASMIRRRYERMKEQYQTPDNQYFAQRLITNFVYKGPVLEWYLRIKLRMEDNYRIFHGLIPRRAVITDIGCGYGFLAYMLSSLSEERTVTGIDYDDEKIETANHCFSKNSQLHFISADVTDYSFNPSDVFILGDVLHYLRPESQQQLLKQCIEKLNSGGIIIIRDGDGNLKNSHRLTRLTEFFSTRLLKFNKTANPLHFISEDDIIAFAEENGFTVENVNNSRYTSNKLYVLRRFP